jgi:hypothetical protein
MKYIERFNVKKISLGLGLIHLPPDPHKRSLTLCSMQWEFSYQFLERWGWTKTVTLKSNETHIRYWLRTIVSLLNIFLTEMFYSTNYCASVTCCGLGWHCTLALALRQAQRPLPTSVYESGQVFVTSHPPRRRNITFSAFFSHRRK